MSQSSQFTTTRRKQRTLAKAVAFSGIGVHTGEKVNMRFCPAAEGHGVVFQRVDLPGRPLIPARIEYVCDTLRSTTIGIDKVRIHTVEHVLAAVRAFEIDNLLIEVSNIEPPIGNGSSDAFVKMIEEAGIVEQQATTPIVKIREPLYWSDKDIHLVALPYDGYRITYTLHYPDSDILKAQFYTGTITSETFKNEIAGCRTFSLYKEVAMLMDRGLIKGGSLDNAVVIQDNVVFSREGLRFPDEMVRHKVLDVIGDLSLVGIPFEAHIIAVRAGHSSNFHMAKAIYKHINSGS
ncbi:MAG: UDP-3-O-acyl-N-acetylglucosamine deacetylase [Parachlamydiaceae bacterium]|nr:UDP-3-O-acyl-N-acetylglucosamine deacetylase [Parachlamydiaceae bacterium]